jgi:restriction endonuclease S subunit
MSNSNQTLIPISKQSKISHLFRWIGSGTTPSSGEPRYYESGIVPWVITGDLNDKVLLKPSRTISNLAVSDYGLKLYPQDSLVIAMYGATIGKTALLGIDATVNQACCVLVKSKQVWQKFLLYWVISKRSYLVSLSFGGGQPNINQDTIKSLRLVVPPLPEQKAIAAYLDRETERIDQKVGLLEEKALLYKELKQSLISKSVTRGLDDSAPRSNSGVDWIGEIPQHWRLVRNKDLFRELKRKAGSKSGEYAVLSLTLKGVIKRDMVNIKGKVPASFDNYLVCKPSDLVICLFDMDVTPRIVGLVKDAGIITSAYTLVEAFTGVSVEYFLYYFLAQNKNGSLLAQSKTLRSTMTFDLFSQIAAPLPPLEEQQAIAHYLDEQTMKIDQIVEAIKEQLGLLKELRKTLINDVVTGKIRVTETIESSV